MLCKQGACTGAQAVLSRSSPGQLALGKESRSIVPWTSTAGAVARHTAHPSAAIAKGFVASLALRSQLRLYAS